MKDLDVAVVEDPMLSHLLHAVSAQSMLCKSCDMHHIIMEFEELFFSHEHQHQDSKMLKGFHRRFEFAN